MNIGQLVATLGIDTIQLRDAEKQVQKFASNTQNSMSQAEKSVGSLGSSFAKLATAVVSIYAIQAAFTAGIRAVDEYQVSVIGVASTLSDLTKSGQGDLKQVFERNLVAAKEMYKSINLEAAKHFASAGEMMTVYNRLVQSGYAVRQDEVAALGILTDKIKLATKGQNVEIQLNQEIRALMDGQAKATSLLAMELQSRLGPQWSSMVDKHKKAGDLLSWLASLYPGLAIANKEIENTIMAQWATTKSLLDLLSIGGLRGAYQDIVGILKKINDYLRNHGEELAGRIMIAWNAVSEAASGVVTVVAEIARWIKVGWGYLEGMRSSLSAIAKQRADMGVGMGLDLMPGTPTPTMSENDPNMIAAKMRNNQKLADEAARYRKETYEKYLADQGQTQIVPGVKADKGAKAAEAAADRMRSILDTLEKDRARLMEGSYAEVAGWLTKTLNDISKVAKKGVDAADAISKAKEVAAAKERKVSEDFNKWYASSIGDNYVKIKYEQDQQTRNFVMNQESMEKLARATGKAMVDIVAENEERKRKIQEVTDRQNRIEALTRQTEQLNFSKQFYDQMASTTPIIDEQNAYRRKSLEVENQMAYLAIDKLIQEKKYLEPLRQELYTQQALVNQAKLYNQQMEARRDLVGWAYQRVKTESQKNTWADFMEGAESYITDAFAQGIQGALGKTQIDFKQTAMTMAQSFVLTLAKRGIHSLFTNIAEGILGGGVLGGKPDGTVHKPFHVSLVGGLGGVGKFGALGGARGEGGGLFRGLFGGEGEGKGLFGGAINQFKKLNQEKEGFFDKRDFTDYADSFNLMVNGLSDSWSLGQEAMTAASMAGEAARLGSMVSGGTEGIGVLEMLAKSAILVDASRAAAATYASVSEIPVVGWILAPIAAAAAFAAVAAYTAFGGSMGGGRSSQAGGGFGPAGYGTETMHGGGIVGRGPVYAHAGWPAPKADEMDIRAQIGEGVLSRKGMANLGKLNMGDVGGGSSRPIQVTFSPSYNYRPTQTDMDRDVEMILKAINRKIGNRGQKLGSGRF